MLTINKDNAVVYMGRALTFDITPYVTDPAFWAMEWDGTLGRVQLSDKPEEIIAVIGVYQAVIDEFIRLAAIEDAPEVVTVETERAKRIGELTEDAAEELGAITEIYPSLERESWPKQESEARAWLADNLTDTPLLDGVLVTRAGSKESLCLRVVELADNYAAFSGVVFGKRQGLCDQVHAAQSIADVRTILWY